MIVSMIHQDCLFVQFYRTWEPWVRLDWTTSKQIKNNQKSRTTSHLAKLEDNAWGLNFTNTPWESPRLCRSASKCDCDAFHRCFQLSGHGRGFALYLWHKPLQLEVYDVTTDLFRSKLWCTAVNIHVMRSFELWVWAQHNKVLEPNEWWLETRNNVDFGLF
jgi:hypothetical protein